MKNFGLLNAAIDAARRRMGLILLMLICAMGLSRTAMAQITVDGDPSDWPTGVYSNPAVVFKVFVRDSINSNDDQFTGGSADVNPISSWRWNIGSANDKTDIENAGMALIGHNLYFFGDRIATNGDASIGIWILKNNVQKLPLVGTTGSFSGSHADGDILITSAFTGGGGHPERHIYKWLSGGLHEVVLSKLAADVAVDSPGGIASPWPYNPKSGPVNVYGANAFFEGFVNIDSLGFGVDICFTEFFMSTRNSQSTTASLQDLVRGQFATRPVVTVANDTVCQGQPAVFTAVVTGGLSPFSYSWIDTNNFVLNQNTYTIPSANSSQIVTVTVKGANGCKSQPDTAQLVVKPAPVITPIPDRTHCNGAIGTQITFNATPAGTTFTWVGTKNVGFGTGGSGTSIGSYTATNNGATTVVDTGIVTPTSGGCPGKADTFLVTVYPTPTVGEHMDVSYCNGATGSAISFSGTPNPGAIFSWTSNANVGFGTANTGNIGTFTATNTSSVTVTARVIVTPSANGCTGRPDTFLVTVYPTPTVGAHRDIPYCNGATGAAITFSGTPNPGVSFSWTGTKDVGFGTANTGNIGTFTATNTSTVTVVDTVIVTPQANGCTGTPDTFLVTVYPTPVVNPTGDATYCNKSTGAEIDFSGTPSNVSFSWVSNANVGFGTANTGNIGTFTATNNGTTPITARVIVTPSANGCTGIPDTFLITVNPTPNVAATGDATYCTNVLADSVHFNGSVAGTSFVWTGTAFIGFPQPGTGTIPRFITQNSGGSPIIDTIIVTPIANGCSGKADTFLITVNPNPGPNAPVDNAALCNNAFQDTIHLASLDPTVIVHWTGTQDLGFGTSGTGNLPSFIGSNPGTSPIVDTITVKSSTNAGCQGADSTAFTITVNPSASPNAPVANFAMCSGAHHDTIDIVGLDVVDTFYWTSSADIGFGTSGKGKIPAFTATVTPVVIIATVTVTPISPSGCPGESGGFVVTVNPLPVVDARDTSVCAGTAPFSLASLGSPGGGTWSGTGVTPPSTFSLTGLGTGAHKVYYTFTDGNSCTSSDSSNVTINALPTVVARDTSICAGTASFSLVSLGTPAGGTWTGGHVTGGNTFNPAGLGAGIYGVNYTVTDGNTCTNSDSAHITINALPNVVARDTTVCTGVAPFSLVSLGTPAGGTWYGAQVTGGNTFNTTSLGAGKYGVNYIVTDGNKCTNNDSAYITLRNCNISVFATFTQGFWGSPGKQCDGAGTKRNATSLINYLLNLYGPITIGLPGRSVIIPVTAATIVNAVMPGGKTPNKLTVGADVIISNTAGSVFATNYLTGGRINNVFLAQVISLRLGTRIIPGLLGFPIVYNPAGNSSFQTCGTSTSDCATFKVSGGCSCWTLSQSVTKYVTKGGTKTATLADLLTLADSLLGGGLTPGTTVGGYVVPSYAAVNDAIDLFNNAFDGFRSFSGSYGCPAAKTPVAGTDGSDLESAMKVYPNPTTGTFTIEMPALDKDAHIVIVDVNGRTVKSATFQANTFGQTQQVDLPNVAPGLYIIHVENNGHIFSKKLMVQ